jgi:DNA-binding XRE family transcriptional regulator
LELASRQSKRVLVLDRSDPDPQLRVGCPGGPRGGGYTYPVDDVDADSGIARAGAAVAARRRELDIKQRELARLKIITASSLIAFEKGRSWPRERTRAKLEEIIQWPAGTIAKIRSGGSIPGTVTTPEPDDTEAPLIVGAVEVAMNTVNTAIAHLPADNHPKFAEHVGPVLADLRRLEAITTRAVRSSRGSPAVLRSLAVVRRRYDEMMMRAAARPGATLGQRLYTARNRANLTAAEAGAALSVPAELIIAVESDQPADAASAARIEALITELEAG